MARLDARRILAFAGLPLLLAAIAVPVAIWRRELWQLFSSTAALRDWVASTGALAPLVLIRCGAPPSSGGAPGLRHP